MYLDDETWTPHFKCWGDLCMVKPKSMYVAVRNSAKTDPMRFKEKIEKAISYWNDNNPMTAFEGVEFDFEEIIKTEWKSSKSAVLI